MSYKKYVCKETGQKYKIRKRKSGIYDIIELYTDKEDFHYMFECIPNTLVLLSQE